MQASAIEFELPDPAGIVTRGGEIVETDILEQMRSEPQGGHSAPPPEGDNLRMVTKSGDGHDGSEKGGQCDHFSYSLALWSVSPWC
jgi:hypothetical protein